MEKVINILIVLFIFGLILLSLFTLDVSPIAWYDEVCLSSESLAFSELGGIYLTANPHIFSGQVLHYGPIFFILSSWFIKIFGFGIFQFRLLGWICGLFIIFYQAFKVSSMSNRQVLIFILLLLSDVTILSASHHGRMETLAIAFIMPAYFMVFKSNGMPIWKFVLSGMLCSFAVLVTPRSGFLLVPIAIQFLFLVFSKRDYLFKSILFGLAFSTPVFIWFGYAFNFSILNVINEFSEIQKVGAGLVGFHFRIPAVQYHIFLSTLIVMFFDGYYNRFQLLITYWYYLLGIILFYFLVKDYGPYSIYIIWLYYSLIFIGSLNMNKLRYLPLILVAINIGFITIKYTTVLSTFELRNYEVATTAISKSIPEGSVVVGDSRYFYSVHLNNSLFLYNEEDYDISTFEKLHREIDDYDYLIISNGRNENFPNVFRTYSEMSNLLLVGSINIENPKSELVEYILTKFSLDPSYSGKIYKRIKS